METPDRSPYAPPAVADFPRFVQVVLELMELHRLDQDGLADKAGKTKSQISLWLNDAHVPNRSNRKALADALDVSLADFEAMCRGEKPKGRRKAVGVDTSQIFRVPLVNSIKAGPSSDSPELVQTGTKDHADYIVAVGLDPAQRDNYFALRVEGDSMSPRFEDGDIAICRWLNRFGRKVEHPPASATVAVRFTEAAPKKLRRHAALFVWDADPELGTVILTKANPAYAGTRHTLPGEEIDQVAIAEVRQTRRC